MLQSTCYNDLVALVELVSKTEPHIDLPSINGVKLATTWITIDVSYHQLVYLPSSPDKTNCVEPQNLIGCDGRWPAVHESVVLESLHHHPLSQIVAIIHTEINRYVAMPMVPLELNQSVKVLFPRRVSYCCY